MCVNTGNFSPRDRLAKSSYKGKALKLTATASPACQGLAKNSAPLERRG